MDADHQTLNEISGKVIGAAMKVSNTLGSGFLEKVYENALAHELRKSGLAVKQQHAMAVLYDGAVVGDYAADILVENLVLVELKAVKALDDHSFRSNGSSATFEREIRVYLRSSAVACRSLW